MSVNSLKSCLKLFVCLFCFLILFFWLRWVWLVVTCDLVPWHRLEPGPPALWAQSLNRLATREDPEIVFWLICLYNIWNKFEMKKKFKTHIRKLIIYMFMTLNNSWKTLTSLIWYSQQRFVIGWVKHNPFPPFFFFFWQSFTYSQWPESWYLIFFFLSFFFWLHHLTYEILVPQPGI